MTRLDLCFLRFIFETGTQHIVGVQPLVSGRRFHRGDVRNLLRDLETVRHVARSIGLLLNADKCEIITHDIAVAAIIRVVLANI